MILGIDEAGRGPVMGPLVLCGVWIAPRRQGQLVELGVRDSKTFGSGPAARRSRAELGLRIRELAAQVTLLTLDAGEVDRRVERGELNQLEQELAEVIITSGPPAQQIVADGARLFAPLSARHPALEARDEADASSPVVAAASIVAKVERDARFAELVAPLEPEFGPIAGGGYANAATARLLRAYAARYGRLPEGVRRSWSWPVLEELGVRSSRQLTLLPASAGEGPAGEGPAGEMRRCAKH